MARRRLNRGYLDRIGRRARYFYLRLILLPDGPHRVALGLAVGVFVGMTPTVPLQTLLALALAWMMRASLAAAYIGIWITNPVTIPFFYALAYFVGRLLTPFGAVDSLPSGPIHRLLQMGAGVGLATLFGGLILGIIFAPITYYLSYRYVARLREWERAKMRKRLALSEDPADPARPGRP